MQHDHPVGGGPPYERISPSTRTPGSGLRPAWVGDGAVWAARPAGRFMRC